MSRLEELCWARDDIKARLIATREPRAAASLHQRFADVLAQIDELGGFEKPKPEETALDEFTKRLHDRESTAKAPRRAKRG